MPQQPQRYRFRPRFRALAVAVLALAGALLAYAALTRGAPILFATGLVGLVLGGGYLASPTWRLSVVLDDDALTVTSASSATPRFRLPWTDVVKVVASPSTHTCFVDGGDPQRSLLVPGDGAPAPYDIEDRAALYDHIVSRVASISRDRIVEVDLLERHR